MEKVLGGVAASSGLAEGKVRIISTAAEAENMHGSEVLVARTTSPLYIEAILRAVAIVTDFGGLLSHASIVARELGIPAVVGTGQATTTLKDGEMVVVDGSEGIVYRE